MIYNIEAPPAGRSVMIDPMDMTRRKTIGKGLAYLDLLVPVARGSEIVYSCPSLPEVRAYAQQQLAGFHEGIKRQLNPHQYPVGLEQGLAELKTELILKARAQRDRAQGERS
jgi:nicotinate phosphoribosyltransferase